MARLLEKRLTALGVPADVSIVLKQVVKSSFSRVADYLLQTALASVQIKSRTSAMPDKFEPPAFPVRRPKLNLQRQDVRHDYFEQEREKTKAIVKKVKTWRQQQEARRAKLVDFLQTIEHLEESEKKEEELENAVHQLKQQEQYAVELQRMKANKEKRQQTMKELLAKEAEYKQRMQTKPLYMRLQEQYFRECQRPQLLAQARILDQIKRQHKPFVRGQLHRFAQEHSRARSTQRVNSHHASPPRHRFVSQTGAELLEQDKRAVKRAEEALFERYMLVERQHKYAELVRDQFVPSVDRFKQKEIELRKVKLLYPQRRDPLKHSTPRPEPSTHRSLDRVKKPSHTPEPKIVKPPPVDYLAAMRAQRVSKTQTVQTQLEKAKSFTQRATLAKEYSAILERKARAKEYSAVGAPPSKALAVTKEIDSLLLSSIKAKLAALTT